MRLHLAGTVAILLAPAWMWAGDPSLLVANASSQAEQNAQADADDLSRMRNRAMIRRFAKNGYLVPLPSRTRFYYLHGIPASNRYSRPWTRLFLDRLSRQFYARFKKPLRVTSVVRTAAQQTRLARNNGNAADASGPERSSHLTGATLDISKRFMTRSARNWMRDVLYSLREQGYLFAVEEFEQPTFHIMVYRDYLGYVEELKQAARNRELGTTASSESSPHHDSPI